MDLDDELRNAEERIEHDEAPRYIVRDASFALSPQQPIEWVIDQLIAEGSLSVFYGEPGSKKTYALISLAVCVALGKTWLGHVSHPRKVLIVDEESGERRLTLRIGAALRGELGEEDTPLEFVSLAGFKMDKKKDVKVLHDLVEERDVGLLIIDALADIMEGDENSKQDTQPVFSALRKIAESTNTAIIVIHHSNKSGGYRGSSAIKGALDLMVKINSENDSNWIHFKSEKTRDAEGVKFTGVATWTEDQFYLSIADGSEKPRENSPSQQYVIEYLTLNGASSVNEIMDHADICSPEAARRAIYSLAKDDVINRINSGGQGKSAIYSLADDHVAE
jgi:hypothetical protein